MSTWKIDIYREYGDRYGKKGLIYKVKQDFNGISSYFTKLDLSNNNLASLFQFNGPIMNYTGDESLMWCREGRGLNFPFKKMTPEISELIKAIPSHITKLDLSNNSLYSIECEGLCEIFKLIPRSVTELDLSYNGLLQEYLKELPDIIAGLPNLEKLSLKENIPDNIGEHNFLSLFDDYNGNRLKDLNTLYEKLQEKATVVELNSVLQPHYLKRVEVISHTRKDKPPIEDWAQYLQYPSHPSCRVNSNLDYRQTNNSPTKCISNLSPQDQQLAKDRRNKEESEYQKISEDCIKLIILKKIYHGLAAGSTAWFKGRSGINIDRINLQEFLSYAHANPNSRSAKALELYNKHYYNNSTASPKLTLIKDIHDYSHRKSGLLKWSKSNKSWKNELDQAKFENYIDKNPKSRTAKIVTQLYRDCLDKDTDSRQWRELEKKSRKF
ncbi:hypothetical protein EDC55_10253 [Allofrancisella inopinata]|uniref:Uncharacterized protein n=1 Tax=Allofrancisella inopinata TaxID=1085647 RepID=A0AAE6YIA6_9GAMM|nr:hypothetical protein [Allofrancisella inopinata]QIV95947.1 hypothetical protein E4K63_03525 [Allofrancisella inopinata]TDT74367.1 hypothetical protein EDC55_10253 [Allofrancisella inopinata]